MIRRASYLVVIWRHKRLHAQQTVAGAREHDIYGAGLSRPPASFERHVVSGAESVPALPSAKATSFTSIEAPPKAHRSVRIPGLAPREGTAGAALVRVAELAR